VVWWISDNVEKATIPYCGLRLAVDTTATTTTTTKTTTTTTTTTTMMDSSSHAS